MSILIKGIDMPREGASLFIEVNPTGHIICQYSDDIVHYGYKNKAVPVPTPHGKLIDADELEQKCMAEPSFVAELLFRELQNAPTIIEAEAD